MRMTLWLVAAFIVTPACSRNGPGPDTSSDTEGSGEPLPCEPGDPVACECAGQPGFAMCLSTGEVGGCDCSSAPDTETTGPASAVCGDGVVEADEICDDGNTDDLDGCRNDCVAHCGVHDVVVADAFVGESFAADVDDAGAVYIASAIGSVVELHAFDAEIAPRWTRILGDVGVEGVTSVSATAGGIYVTGKVAGTPSSSLFAYRVDTDGNVVAGWPLVIHDADGGTAVADGRGDLVVVGRFGSADDMRVRKYAPDGTERWTYGADAGDGAADLAVAVAVGPDDGLVVGVDIDDGSQRTTRVVRLPPDPEAGNPAPVASWTTPVLGAVEGWAGTQTFGALAVGEDGFVAAVNGEEPGSFWIVSIGDRGLVRWSASDRDLEVDLPLRLTGAEATTHGYLGFLAAPVGAAGVAALRLDVDGRRLCAGPIEELDLELSGVDPLRTMTAGVVAIGVTAAQPRQPWIGRLVE